MTTTAKAATGPSAPDEGAACGRRRIARLMRAAGIAGRHRATIPDPHAVTGPDEPARFPV